MAADLLHFLFYDIVLPNSMAGTLFILFIVLFRQATKRLSKGYVRILWILLIVELLAPPLLQGSFHTIRNLAQNAQLIQDHASAGPAAWRHPAAQREEHLLDVQQAENVPDMQKNSALDARQAEHAAGPQMPGQEGSLKGVQAGNAETADISQMPAALRTAAAVMWLIGVAGFCIVYLCQYQRLKRRMADAAYVKEEGCWVTKASRTPFVMPHILPRIYMPYGITGRRRGDILAHERQHIKNMDHLVKCFAAFAAAVHWFNPFVWAAYAWIGKDLEMYCDECVLRGRSMEERRRYSSTLLQFAADSSGLSVMLQFGESDTENRIRHILFLKKPHVLVSIILVLVMAAGSVFFLTSKDADAQTDGKEAGTGIFNSGNADSIAEKEDKSGPSGGQDTLEALAGKIAEQTDEPFRGKYYADYDGDGSFELFAITGAEPADGTSQIWFAGAQEVTCLMDDAAGYTAFNEEDQGICEVSGGQKLFLADCGTMGSIYFSKCFYVQSGKPYEADLGEYLLEQIEGDDFKVYVDAYDRIYMDGTMSGHTRKPYYAKWTGAGFEEYQAQKITFDELAAYEGAWSVLSELDQLYYVVSSIYLRSNGLIQINVVNMADDSCAVFENVTLAVKGSSVEVEESNRAQGLLERASYGGIYQASGIFEADGDDTVIALLKKVEAAQKLKRRMMAFAKAYFAGSADTVRKYLAASYTSQVEVYDHPEQADGLESRRIKGIGRMLEEGSLDECTLSLEFRVPGEDSFTYLSVWFVKEDGAWKAASYGLEK